MGCFENYWLDRKDDNTIAQDNIEKLCEYCYEQLQPFNDNEKWAIAHDIDEIFSNYSLPEFTTKYDRILARCQQVILHHLMNDGWKYRYSKEWLQDHYRERPDDIQAKIEELEKEVISHIIMTKHNEMFPETPIGG